MEVECLTESCELNMHVHTFIHALVLTNTHTKKDSYIRMHTYLHTHIDR